MERKSFGLASFAVLLAAPAAFAQTGFLDQVSPTSATSFGVLASTQWQQQVRVGIGGQLEGFQLTFTGIAGSGCDVRLRVGDGWNTGPVAWMGSYTKSGPGTEFAFFDVTGANIQLAAGDTFVIETQGNNNPGIVLIGNSGDPVFYPEELYLNGPGCFGGCLFRHGFQTWMLSGLGTNYCTSTVNSTGAASIISAAGSGSISANDLVLTANNLPFQPGIFIAGPTPAQIPFFDGFLCIDSNGLQRFINAFFPCFGSGMITEAVDIATSAPGGLNVMAGSSYFYQRWFRDLVPGGSHRNFSDAIEIVYTP